MLKVIKNTYHYVRYNSMLDADKNHRSCSKKTRRNNN